MRRASLRAWTAAAIPPLVFGLLQQGWGQLARQGCAMAIAGRGGRGARLHRAPWRGRPNRLVGAAGGRHLALRCNDRPRRDDLLWAADRVPSHRRCSGATVLALKTVSERPPQAAMTLANPRVACMAVVLIGCLAPAVSAHGVSYSGSAPGWTLDPWILVPLAVTVALFAVGLARLRGRSTRSAGAFVRQVDRCLAPAGSCSPSLVDLAST